MSDAADAAAAMAFQHWFGLEPGSGRVLLALWRRCGGASAPAAELARETGHTPASMRRHHIPQIRQAMDTEAIDFDGRGYNLTETGRAECLAAIREIGDELMRAARGRG
jgi:hypothetical protein